jgi:hypothetical protein
MQKFTEDSLVLTKQPQKVFTTYNFPLAVVVDMINEARVEVTQLEKSLFGTDQYKAFEYRRSLSPTESFFAARKHMHNKNVYVIRIHYKFLNENTTKYKLSVIVYHAEAIDEQDYHPVLPL